MEWQIEYLGPILLLIIFVFFYSYKKITKDPDALTSKHKVKRTYSKTNVDMKKIITKALMNARFKKVGFNNELDRHYAHAGLSFWSFGENITVKVAVTEEGQEVKFASMCAFTTTIIDWGKNKRNAKKFFEHFEELIG
ncbi:MAG: hypothetical protein COA49_08715 [Bacteroidetes bacterium]|nr:MAG: hypothetical protein COA49_08715 [Bacteroidota bacterium]